MLVPKRGVEEPILGCGTIVGAGAVVKESFSSSYQLIAGVPAKFIKFV